jgi:hypothetical protein
MSSLQSPSSNASTPDSVRFHLPEQPPVIDNTAEWRRRAIIELEDYNSAPFPEQGEVRHGFDLLLWWQVRIHMSVSCFRY